jgi:hypothetical protein
MSETNFKDIVVWNHKPEKFFNFAIQGFKMDGEKKQKLIRPLNIDAIRLYALLKKYISPQPNGVYTLLQDGYPLDNLFWWDFLLECDKGFIHIWRTPQVLEAQYLVEIEDFDLERFLKDNLSKYHSEVDDTIKGFENHSTYINHYESYRSCVGYLWKEVSQIDLKSPSINSNHLIKGEVDFDKMKADIAGFGERSVKFHTLGKSLILNSAFMVESFINLFIRVGATTDLRNYDDVLQKHLNSSFRDKLKNLKFYSQIMLVDIDMEKKEVKDVLELMTLRNKYVHYDESSVHNKLGTQYFDIDFPVFPTLSEMPGIEHIKNTHHNPSIDKVRKSYESAKDFILFIQSLIKPELKDFIIYLMSRNPISFNERKKVYSAISGDVSVTFFAQMKDDNEGISN